MRKTSRGNGETNIPLEQRAHFYTWSCMCEKQPGCLSIRAVLRRCAPYKGKALAPRGG